MNLRRGVCWRWTLERQCARQIASNPNSKTDFLDFPDVVKKKLRAEEGNVDDNGVLSFVKAMFLPSPNSVHRASKMGSSNRVKATNDPS